MHRSHALAVLAVVPALALLTPTTSGPTAPLVTAVSSAAWTCTAWLLLVLVLEQGSRLPGALGRSAGTLARRVAPRSVRALVRVAVGAGLAASLLTGQAALAEDRTPTVAGSASDFLDWPGLAPVTAAPVAPAPLPGRPTVTATHPATPAAPRPAPRPVQRPSHPSAPRPPQAPARTQPPAEDVPVSSEVVVVHAGDSLWSLAAVALGPGASDARVAQEWPRWWAANRSVVGDHPDLIHPGDRLTAPRPLGNDS